MATKTKAAKMKATGAKKREWNGSGVAATQERRGRKGHSIIDEVPGLADWIVEQCLQSPKPTIITILDRLKGTIFLQQLEDLGHEKGLSRTTLGEFVGEWKQFVIQQGLERARRRVAIDNATALNETDDEEEIFEIDSAIANVISIEVLERLQDARASGTPIDEELRENLKVAARYQTARTMRARARFLINRGLRRVEDRVIARMSTALEKKYPKVMPHVREALREAIAQETLEL